VYATDAFAAEITPAFGRQHVLFYDMNSNPAARVEERSRESDLLVNPEIPLSARREVLKKRKVGLVVLSHADEETEAAVLELVRDGAIIYDDSEATVWRVDLDARQ
jgi:hypothetical protein